MANILYDGHKKTSINNLPEEAWEYLRGEGQDDGLKKLQKSVPWLYRGMNIRAQSVASVPFALYKGEVEYDVSDDWQNKIEIMPSPKRLFIQLEMASVLFNYAYLHQPKNKYNFAKELRYLMPLTMKPIITEQGGLESFERRLRGREIPLAIEDVLYFWGLDPYVEIGHPQSSPATAAMAAAGVLMSVDEFAGAFFSRGAIKATILSVPQGTLKSERDNLKKWYAGIISGIKNAFATEVLNADAVTATPIGEGIKELENTALTKEKREDISTALGIPQSKLFSTAATDSNRVEDEKSYLTDLIVPRCEFYQEVLNSQLFNDMGLKFRFRPEKMDAFQEDETERSTAFLNYRGGGMQPSVIAEMLGLELPDGVDYADLDAYLEEQKAQMMEVQNAQQSRQQEKDKLKDEKEKFHRAVKNGKNPESFVFNYLDENAQALLKAQYTVSESDKLSKSLTDAIDAIRTHPGESIVHVNVENSMPEVKVHENVLVNVPEQQPADIKNIVQVDVPEQKQTIVNVEPAPVTVENIVEAPVVNVTNELPPKEPRHTTVKRDDWGNIIEMDTE